MWSVGSYIWFDVKLPLSFIKTEVNSLNVSLSGNLWMFNNKKNVIEYFLKAC